MSTSRRREDRSHGRGRDAARRSAARARLRALISGKPELPASTCSRPLQIHASDRVIDPGLCEPRMLLQGGLTGVGGSGPRVRVVFAGCDAGEIEHVLALRPAASTGHDEQHAG